MKKYIGIIASVVYALLFRLLVEFHVMEINSWTYLILVPVLMGYLPFVLDKKTFVESKVENMLNRIQRKQTGMQKCLAKNRTKKQVLLVHCPIQINQ
jgi:hypothetical protein